MNDILSPDSPAKDNELTVLRATLVGGTRRSMLFPALPIPLEWTCVKSEADAWEYDARFCGELLMSVSIVLVDDALELTVKE